MDGYDVVIVGAGFSGLALAHHLPRGLRVLVCEAKPAVGATVESTGLITERTRKEFASFFDVDRHITNPIRSICVVAPGFREHFVSTVDEPWIYQTDTRGLVAGLASSLPENITVMPGAALVDVVQENGQVSAVKLQTAAGPIMAKTRFLVGADGGRSKVASLLPGLDRNRRFLFGYERVIPGQVLLGASPETTIYHYWFGEFSLGYGGWLSPTKVLGRPAFRIGLAKHLAERGDAAVLTDAFLARLKAEGHVTFDPSDVAGAYAFGGTIPIGGRLRRIAHGNALLIGDAAGFCGAFAADGIKGSVVSAKEAAPLIAEYLGGDPAAPSRLLPAVERHGGLLSYYGRQVRYRWLWDRMRRDRTFRAMYGVIAAEKDDFLHQFCDSKDGRKSLVRVVLKPRHAGRLLGYAWWVLVDMLLPRR